MLREGMEPNDVIRQLDDLFDCKDAACYIAQRSPVLTFDERTLAAYALLVRKVLPHVPLPTSPSTQNHYWEHFTSFDALAQAMQKYLPVRKAQNA